MVRNNTFFQVSTKAEKILLYGVGYGSTNFNQPISNVHNYLFFIFLVILPIYPGSLALNVLNSSDGRAFLSFENASLLPTEKYLTAGSYLTVNSNTGSILSQTSFSQNQENSGFGLGYEFDDAKKILHSLCAGFGVGKKNFYIGSSARMLYSNSLGGKVDFSGSYISPKNQKISFIFRNALLPDTTFGDNFRETALVHTYTFDKLNLFTTVDLSYIFGGDLFKKDGYRLGTSFESVFFKNPSLHFSAGIRKDSEPTGKTTVDLSALLGLGIKTGVSHLLVAGGMVYDFHNKQTLLRAFASFSPVRYLDKKPPHTVITLSDTLIFLKGQGANRNVVIGLSCNDTKTGSGIANWTLVICKSPDMYSETPRTFAGGGIPPSSIIWDGRSGSGSLVSPGTYFIQLSSIDKNGNVGRSGWIPIHVRD